MFSALKESLCLRLCLEIIHLLPHLRCKSNPYHTYQYLTIIYIFLFSEKALDIREEEPEDGLTS